MLPDSKLSKVICASLCTLSFLDCFLDYTIVIKSCMISSLLSIFFILFCKQSAKNLLCCISHLFRRLTCTTSVFQMKPWHLLYRELKDKRTVKARTQERINSYLQMSLYDRLWSALTYQVINQTLKVLVY